MRHFLVVLPSFLFAKECDERCQPHQQAHFNAASAAYFLGISGGIAAYKTPELVRQLKAAGFEVRVALSENAAQFVSPLSLQAVSGAPVLTGHWDAEHEQSMPHIQWARWADLCLLAPASANLLAHMAHGLANTPLTTVLLATKAPIWICPAMNVAMYEHPSVQANLQTLISRGVQVPGYRCRRASLWRSGLGAYGATGCHRCCVAKCHAKSAQALAG